MTEFEEVQNEITADIRAEQERERIATIGILQKELKVGLTYFCMKCARAFEKSDCVLDKYKFRIKCPICINIIGYCNQ